MTTDVANDRKKLRLAISLTLSGIVATALSQGEWSITWFAVLAPAPLLVAARCMPFALGTVLAFVAGAAGRLISVRGVVAPDDVALAAFGGAALWVVPFVIDRLCATWLRRVGFLAFPCAAVVLSRIADAYLPGALSAQAHVPAHHITLDVWGHDLSRTVVEWFLWMIASATSGLASLKNYVAREPYSQDEREAGLRWGGVSGLTTFIALFAGGALRLHYGAPTDVAAGPAHMGLVAACIAGVVALVVGALVVRSRAPAA